MAWVWVSIGSNIDRENNIRGSLKALEAEFGALVVSPTYETPAEGFDGDAFYNLVAGFNTELTPTKLHAKLREIEHEFGRVRTNEKFNARTMDIDALTYDDQVTDEGGKHLPRDEIEKYAFVLKPLVDVAPDEIHPECGVSYAALWENFSGDKNVLIQVHL